MLFEPQINGVIQSFGAGSYEGTGLGDAPSYGDALYDRLYQANPYRKLTYNKSWWQSLLESMGFRTGYDTWREQAEVNAREWDAQVAQMISQNEYNDPSAMAQRERAAGMNPDLLGIGDVAESAKPYEDVNGMQPNPSDDFQHFGETFMGVLGKTVALYKDFKGLSQLDNMIEAGDLENVKKMYDSIDSFIENKFHESDFNSRSSYNKAIARVKGELEGELQGDYESSSAYRNGIREKDWKRWTENAGERLDSLMGDMTAFNAYAGAGNARVSATQAMLNPNYLKTDEQYDTMIGITPIISAKYAEFLEAKAKYDAYQENLREGALLNQGIQQDITGQYLDQMNEGEAGAKQASADLSEYDAKWYQNKLNQTIADMKKQCFDYLKNLSRHNRFANLMLLNWTMDDMVNIGINASANASVGLNLGLGANIANTVSTIFKP